MVYIFMVFNGYVAMNISDNHIDIFVSTCLSSYNIIILFFSQHSMLYFLNKCMIFIYKVSTLNLFQWVWMTFMLSYFSIKVNIKRLATLNNIIIYTLICFNRHVSMNISVNHVVISVSACWSCLNDIIIYLSLTLNVRFYEQIYDVYIYSLYNTFSSMNMDNNYVRIFINYTQNPMLYILNKWLIYILRFFKRHVSMDIYDNHVVIFVSTCWLCLNVIIIYF